MKFFPFFEAAASFWVRTKTRKNFYFASTSFSNGTISFALSAFENKSTMWFERGAVTFVQLLGKS